MPTSSCTISAHTRENLCNIEHFSEQKTQKHNIPIFPPKEYGKIRDGVVIACVDIILFSKGHVLLAKRRIEPLKSQWWVIGGKMNPGETPPDAAARKLWEEAHVKVPSKRLQYLGVYSTVFKKRNEPPFNNGSHTINLTYLLDVTEKEKQSLHLDEHEYESSQWFTFAELKIMKKKTHLHPVLQTIIDDLISSHQEMKK